MSRHQIVSRLGARGWPIVYSNGPLNVWDRGKPEWNASPWLNGFDRHGAVLVDRPGRLSALWPKSKLLTDLAFAAHARHLLRAAGRRDAIAYVFHPYQAHYLRRLKVSRVVYHAYDDFSRTVDWTPSLARWERELAERSQLVLAASPGMARSLVDRHPRLKPRLLESGADAERFSSGRGAPCPADLAAIPRPRIGYTGRVTPTTDFRLLRQIATTRPDWHLVLVGPILLEASVPREQEREVKAQLAGCRELPNVHVLGGKPVSDVPAYMANMDVNTMCYRTDDGGWWAAISPLKMHEYLAVGQPVVSADLETARPFRDVIAIASGVEQWIAAIAHALETGGVGTPEQRQAVAGANSWDRRVDQLEQWLGELIEGRA